ncbi:MAG: hypothetical protein M3O30_11940 [Planctomycetota bacterium]|nr:hypothetical protein [Planctomycetota bacterium]
MLREKDCIVSTLVWPLGVNTSIPGWTVNPIADSNSDFPSAVTIATGIANTPDGNQVAEIAGNGTISQTITLISISSSLEAIHKSCLTCLTISTIAE